MHDGQGPCQVVVPEGRHLSLGGHPRKCSTKGRPYRSSLAVGNAWTMARRISPWSECREHAVASLYPTSSRGSTCCCCCCCGGAPSMTRTPRSRSSRRLGQPGRNQRSKSGTCAGLTGKSRAAHHGARRNPKHHRVLTKRAKPGARPHRYAQTPMRSSQQSGPGTPRLYLYRLVPQSNSSGRRWQHARIECSRPR